LDHLVGFEVDLSSHVLIGTGSLEDDPIEPERGRALIETGAGSAGVSLVILDGYKKRAVALVRPG
jgi:hypothetical protein